ncbi:hypothetical protein J3R30DRAFT_3707898 [Lentinula aciculospora]|uniref:Uncharacterized protein n=1 Tax=Lentinula aciculospora TaxID=153920 RepID=A0A9W9A475_9AGAR|nr:hypothetical protein J3R30DRAFT_3707898 [Lentinula aciculospora]
MPPKTATGDPRPQHGRKQSTINLTGNGDSASAPKEKGKGKGKEREADKDRNKKDAKDMMPLPPPPPAKPLAILEPEFGALEESLKRKYLDSMQTPEDCVHKHAPQPPRSLTSTLEQELGRYDQICDTLDAHLACATGQHIDLTAIDDGVQLPPDIALLHAGNSADKPIKLDLNFPMDVQMSDLPSDLFGENGAAEQRAGPSTDAEMEKLFGPETAGTASASDANDAAGGMDMSMLLSENNEHDDSLFASLSAGDNGLGEGVAGPLPLSDATQDVSSEGGGDFDYSMFFNDASPNQDQINLDMMELFQMDNKGAPAEPSKSSNNQGDSSTTTT